MLTRTRSALVCSFLALVLVVPAQASITVYDNLATAAVAGFSDLNASTPIFGDSLTLAQGGQLEKVGFSLFNSTSGGNTGSILAGTMLVSFYDNTTPYAGGALALPLLGAVNIGYDFSGFGGLLAGQYLTDLVDLSAFNINLPTNILVTQKFTQTAGASTRNGFVLFANPTVGSSPSSVYLKSATITEGLYTIGTSGGQVGYTITLVPEPVTLVLAGLGAAAACFRRRR
jgi:hypothetical protein